MRKLEAIKDILLGIWSVSYLIRLVGKLSNLYEIPKWSIYLTLVSLIFWTTLSLTMYFIKKMKKFFINNGYWLTGALTLIFFYD